MERHGHAWIDARNLAYDRANAAAIRRHPALVQVARDNLARWLANDGDRPSPPLKEWEDILFFLDAGRLADFLESETPKANRLRQSSPFLGIVERAAELDGHAAAPA
jgi:hypothetical protein